MIYFTIMFNPIRWIIIAVCMSLSFNSHLHKAQLPADEEYVGIGANGHLYLEGERVRFRGAIGTVPGKSYEENEAMVKRLKKLKSGTF